MKLTLRACAASVGRSSIGDLVLARDVLHAGDLCCLSCAVKHCHKAVWYILSCSDCITDCLLSPAIAPKSSSFASLLVADACLNLQQAYLNMSLLCKCGTATSLPHATIQQCSFSTCNIECSNADQGSHDSQKKMSATYLMPKQVQQPVNSSALQP